MYIQRRQCRREWDLYIQTLESLVEAWALDLTGAYIRNAEVLKCSHIVTESCIDSLMKHIVTYID